MFERGSYFSAGNNGSLLLKQVQLIIISLFMNIIYILVARKREITTFQDQTFGLQSEIFI
jgi:hypothetical protein